MGKRSQRHRVRLEKTRAGCMWGLISLFDFRHGRATRRILLDKKLESSHTVGDGYPNTKLKMLTYPSEKGQTTENLENSELARADGLKTSVKELMEEEMFSEQGLKKKLNSADVQLNQLRSENGGHDKRKPKQAKKNRSKSCDIIDMGGVENSSHQVLDQDTLSNLDLEGILEELCRSNEKGHCLKHDLVDEKLSAAIKVFISQRLSNDKNFAEDGTHHSKEFAAALQMLSSNKELFFELLKDPNSLLVKHIQSVEVSNLLEEESSKQRPDELLNRKHRKFFRRRSKSQDNNSLKVNEKSQPSSRIVLLKPGPAAPRNSGTENERNASQFSLNEIKRRLKHAMGKDWHGISRNGKFPSEFQNLKTNEKAVGEANGGWSSPNRNHFYTERFTKSPLGIKRGDKNGKSMDSETTVVDEIVENPKKGVSNIYIEAKKHLSEMLSNGDEKEELMSRKLPKTLGRILSLPEYSFTPIGSPGNDGELRFVTAQKILSPKDNLESQSCITNDKPDEKVQSPSSNPDVSCELNLIDSVRKTESPTREEKNCEEVHESVQTSSSEFQEGIQVLDVSCESSNSLFSREIEIHAAAEVYDEERSSKSVKLDSVQENEFLSSPPLSPGSSSVNREVENPGTCTDRPEKPSPISVLEPLFSEDDISPSSTKPKPVATTIQPLQIHFEENVSSDLYQVEESAFEYVEAVLLGSDLNWDEFLLRWISSGQILDPSLFDEVELFSSRSSHDQKLLFDCTDEVLKEVCERYFVPSLGKLNVQPVPKGMKLINEVWEGVEWHIRQYSTSNSLDQLVRKDMSKPGKWMDLRFETDHIVIELEESILEEMVEDSILSFHNDSVEDNFSAISDELI